MATKKQKTSSEDDILKMIQQNRMGQINANQTTTPIPNSPMSTIQPGYPVVPTAQRPPALPDRLNQGNLGAIATASDDDSKKSVQQLFREIMDIYQPEMHAGDRFNDLIDNMPQRNKPGIGRRIAASAAAIGQKEKGPEIAEKFMYSPYMRDMADWKEKVEPSYQAANLERFGNVNERTGLMQIANTHLGLTKAGETERHNRETEEATRVKNEIAEFRARHPNFKFDTTGPKVKAMDPLTGEVVVTPWDTGRMSDYDKMNLGLTNDLVKIEATGNQRNQNIKTQGEETRLTNKEKSPTGAAAKKGDLAAEELERIYINDTEAKKYILKQGNVYSWQEPKNKDELYRYQQIRNKYDSSFQITAPVGSKERRPYAGPPLPAEFRGPNAQSPTGRPQNNPPPSRSSGAGPVLGGRSNPQLGGSSQTIYGTQKSTGRRTVSTDGGKTWQYADGGQ